MMPERRNPRNRNRFSSSSFSSCRLAALARKLQTPYPIVLVVAGCPQLHSGHPQNPLNPDLIFLVCCLRFFTPLLG